MNIYKDWKAKLESAYSFMLKYSKITVCTVTTAPDRSGVRSDVHIATYVNDVRMNRTIIQ